MELASSVRRVEARCQEAEQGTVQEREGREEAEHQLTAAQRKVRQLSCAVHQSDLHRLLDWPARPSRRGTSWRTRSGGGSAGRPRWLSWWTRWRSCPYLHSSQLSLQMDEQRAAEREQAAARARLETELYQVCAVLLAILHKDWNADDSRAGGADSVCPSGRGGGRPGRTGL